MSNVGVKLIPAAMQRCKSEMELKLDEKREAVQVATARNLMQEIATQDLLN